MLDTQVYLLWVYLLRVYLLYLLLHARHAQAKGFMHLKDAADLLSFTALGMSDQQARDA